MELIYLYHSGFALLGEGYTLVVDYFEDSESATNGIWHRELLHRPGRLYVLSSHSHADHFNPEILKWKAERPDVVFVFSRDICQLKGLAGIEAVYLDKGEVYEDDLLRVRAFGSTDIGISFLMEMEGKKVFHAGDLNNWHWMDEGAMSVISCRNWQHFRLQLSDWMWLCFLSIRDWDVNTCGDRGSLSDRYRPQSLCRCISTRRMTWPMRLRKIAVRTARCSWALPDGDNG